MDALKPYCEKCQGEEMLPLVKNGEIIPYTFVYCECHQNDHEYEPRIKPSDFDFPMSYSIYRSLCQQHGWDDPGPCEPSEPEETEVHFVDTQWTARQWDIINQLRGQALFLQGKLNKHITLKSKPKVDVHRLSSIYEK